MASNESRRNGDIIVTGSAGHLGTALMLSLRAQGVCPIGIDVLASPTTTVVGSVSNRELIQSVLRQHRPRHILHAAALHKPHVGSHSKQTFIDTNITGTLVMLEEAAACIGSILESFIFFSTTSTFGAALSPKPGQPAAWIDENVVPMPKNIYGVTKVAAEDMCWLVHKQLELPVLVLRTSRFFPEDDDDEERRKAMDGDNLKVLELAYRRVDIADIVDATLLAMKKARSIGFAKYIISAPPPFSNSQETLALLDSDPAAVFRQVMPAMDGVFDKLGWKQLERVDRVYDSTKAVRELGWTPKHTFQTTIERLGKGEEWQSQLAKEVGSKGYHEIPTDVYTTVARETFEEQ